MLYRLCAVLALGLTMSLAALAPSPAWSQSSPTAADQAEIQRLQGVLDALSPETGIIPLPQAEATLNLGEAYYFLNAQDSRRVLVEVWGNPPEVAEGVLGMVFPAGASPASDSWGAVLTWVNDGYVSDEDAAQIDYDQLLTSMREGEAEQSRRLREQGYPGATLVGWAQAPSYDAAQHKLIWAKELAFDGSEQHTLNYDVRVLGRRGVLSMNIVSTMDQLDTVRPAADQLMGIAAFNDGARYTDYVQGDRKAAYGVAGLVAGGAALAVAKKAGILGVLFLILKKGGVFLIAGAAAAFGWLRNLLGGGGKSRGRRTVPAGYAEPEPTPAPDGEPGPDGAWDQATSSNETSSEPQPPDR